MASMPLSNGVWKKALATFLSAISGYFLAITLDPVLTPWTWAWFRHELIVMACIGLVAEMRYIKEWADYVLSTQKDNTLSDSFDSDSDKSQKK